MRKIFFICLFVSIVITVAYAAVTRMKNLSITNSTLSGSTVSTSTLSGNTITNSPVDNSAIGQVTPASGTFTNLALTRGLINTSAVKIQNFGVGGTLCTSGPNVGDTCVTTVLWNNAFTDTNYTLICTGVTQHQNGYLTVEGKATTGFAIRTTLAGGPSGTGAHYDEADCIGIHAGF